MSSEENAASAAGEVVEAAKRRNVVDHVVTTISKAIDNGDLRPGDRLVEAELTERLEAGRGSVREALRRLEANKYIIFEPNRGARVAKPTPDEIRAMMRIRGVIAGLGARAAAENIHLPEVAARVPDLYGIIETERAQGDPTQHREFNGQFHRTINEMSKITYVGKLLREVNIPMLYGQYFRRLTHDQWRTNLEDHYDIARAIERGDPEAAAHYAELHMLRFIEIASEISEEF